MLSSLDIILSLIMATGLAEILQSKIKVKPNKYFFFRYNKFLFIIIFQQNLSALTSKLKKKEKKLF